MARSKRPRPDSPRSRRFTNRVHYFFGGDRIVNLERIPPEAQEEWLKRGDLVERKPGKPHVNLTRWGSYNKFVRAGFGRPWHSLSHDQRQRVIEVFVRANLENALFPTPLPENIKTVPYNAVTRAGMIRFFEYARDLYRRMRMNELPNLRSSSPEVRETARREYLRYSGLISAHIAIVQAVKKKNVWW